MGTEEKEIDDMFRKELAKLMNIPAVTRFPAVLRVEQEKAEEEEKGNSRG